MPTFRPTVAAPAAPAPKLRRRLALAASTGVVVAFVAWLEAAPSPHGPVMGGPVPGRPGSQDLTWDAALSADLAGQSHRSTASRLDLPGKLPLTQIELAPNVVGDQTAGFAIRTVPETGPLAEAGLRTNDILMTIDGLPLDADRARRLADEFGGLDDVEVTYQRNGELRETLVIFRPR